MYIKLNTKKNKGSQKKRDYLHLVESYRGPNGPRQRLVLNLGPIDIPKDQWKEVANAIENKLYGQQGLLPVAPSLEQLVNESSRKILKARTEKTAQECTKDKPKETVFVPAELETISVSNTRSVGPEYVGHAMYKELQIDQFLKRMGVPESTLPLYEALIVGRLVHPASEHATWDWLQNRSAFFELAGDLTRNSLSSFYRAGDRLLQHKDELESHLATKEKELFSLQEKFCLFDLTNTFLEGQAEGNLKAKRGRSKEKRSDCKLMTLGMIIDETGFPKYSKVFAGNQSEPATLKTIISSLRQQSGKQQSTSATEQPVTVIMDAGIATEENIHYVRSEKLHYIVVKRGSRGPSFEQSPREVIRQEKEGGVTVQRAESADREETFLLCRSANRVAKDSGIRRQQEERFLAALQKLKEGLSLPRKRKRDQVVAERIGRLRQKYPRASKCYTVKIEVDDKDDLSVSNTKKANGSCARKRARIVTDIIWAKVEAYDKLCEREGCYLLRTDRSDLSSREIWETYISLLRIEAAFKSLKSHLGLRPIFHRVEERADAHLFISVIAYHLLCSIEYRLRNKGNFHTWATIREQLSNHQRLTLSVKTKSPEDETEKWKHLRVCSEPEPVHKEIYKALDLHPIPLKRKTTTTL